MSRAVQRAHFLASAAVHLYFGSHLWFAYSRDTFVNSLDRRYEHLDVFPTPVEVLLFKALGMFMLSMGTLALALATLVRDHQALLVLTFVFTWQHLLALYYWLYWLPSNFITVVSPALIPFYGTVGFMFTAFSILVSLVAFIAGPDPERKGRKIA